MRTIALFRIYLDGLETGGREDGEDSERVQRRLGMENSAGFKKYMNPGPTVDAIHDI